MARRLNFTGRKKINLSDCLFRIRGVSGNLTFDAQLDLGSYKFESASKVFVEAYRSASTITKRFDFGCVGTFHPPDDLSLNEFGRPEGIFFRIKISGNGEDEGRLIGEADRVIPLLPHETAIQSEPLLPVRPENLGDEIWRVDFSTEPPELQINERISDWRSFARLPIFRALAAPAVMKEILYYCLVIDARPRSDPDYESDSWSEMWLNFAESLPGVGTAPQELQDTESIDQRTDLTDWIDDATNAFAKQANVFQVVEKLLS